MDANRINGLWIDGEKILEVNHTQSESISMPIGTGDVDDFSDVNYFEMLCQGE